MATFEENLLSFLDSLGGKIHAWCILPNHYHVLLHSAHILDNVGNIGRFHDRRSFGWNGEESTRGRKVWHNCAERAIRTERHFWATVNYVHHQPVHHRYCQKWLEWPFSSAERFLEHFGNDEAARIWREYPLLDYGKDWDDPRL
jgi:putative transposase